MHQRQDRELMTRYDSRILEPPNWGSLWPSSSVIVFVACSIDGNVAVALFWAPLVLAHTIQSSTIFIEDNIFCMAWPTSSALEE